MTDEIRALIAKLRRDADDTDETAKSDIWSEIGKHARRAEARKIRDCADELEAALARADGATDQRSTLTAIRKVLACQVRRLEALEGEQP